MRDSNSPPRERTRPYHHRRGLRPPRLRLQHQCLRRLQAACAGGALRPPQTKQRRCSHHQCVDGEYQTQKMARARRHRPPLRRTCYKLVRAQNAHPAKWDEMAGGGIILKTITDILLSSAFRHRILQTLNDELGVTLPEISPCLSYGFATQIFLRRLCLFSHLVMLRLRTCFLSGLLCISALTRRRRR